MPRIAVVLTARPSYAKWKTVLEALRARLDVELQIIVAASANLERYGRVRDVLVADRFAIAAECWTVLEGETLLTGARETGIALMDLASVYHRLQPDIVCVMADRREILAAAAAATYQGMTVAHVQGGERSGSVDDYVRDAVTALSTYHFTSTELARYRVVSLTGAYERVWNTGCPSIDLAKRALSEPPVTVKELGGAGKFINPEKPFGIILQHPVTREADEAYTQMRMTLEAWPLGFPGLVFWPGQDAGAGGASKAVREMQQFFHTVRNLPPSRFLRLMTQCAVIVGNSSASVREGAFLGTPAVVIGSRQYGRERAANVRDVGHTAEITTAIQEQRAHGRYPSDGLYGRGDAGQQIAEVLAHVCTRIDSSPVRV